MKQELLMRVRDVRVYNDGAYGLLKLVPVEGAMPRDIEPGQFVQVDVPDCKGAFLRRPISINFVDYDANELWLLVRAAGKGSRSLIACEAGQLLSLIMSLGRGFSMPAKGERVLLVGGGVGVAPLLYFGKVLKDNGYAPEFALGARTASDLLMLDEFEKYGPVHVATESGEMGVKGFVTQLPAMAEDIAHIACCGPTPMMRAVAKIAKARGICCEVSLENAMACGLGACLCCVEDTDHGRVCVCTEGPVFNINQLQWEL